MNGKYLIVYTRCGAMLFKHQMKATDTPRQVLLKMQHAYDEILEPNIVFDEWSNRSDNLDGWIRFINQTPIKSRYYRRFTHDEHFLQQYH